jgi:peptidoglycan/xylan/chitin deacetylase (PgdA/CDA1 family)
MVSGGMAIGSHTVMHQVLSQMSPDRQFEELSHSRTLFEEKAGIQVDSLAYPVGRPGCFSEQTQKLAREAGYRAAFSFYGGTNLSGGTAPFDVRRISGGSASWPRFRVQASVCRLTGAYWP